MAGIPDLIDIHTAVSVRGRKLTLDQLVPEIAFFETYLRFLKDRVGYLEMEPKGLVLDVETYLKRKADAYARVTTAEHV